MFRRCMILLAATLSLSTADDKRAARLVLRLAWPDPPNALQIAAISADSRYVAFISAARLIPADTNALDDIYVLDRDTHQLTLATLSYAGGATDGSTLNPHLSADGRYLAFNSVATNLTGTPDRNEADDVFVHDRLDKVTRRVSAGPGGQEPNGRSANPALSGDGRRVVFESTATNLVPGEDGNGAGYDVYLADLSTGLVTRISVDNEGRQFADAFSPRISGNGQFVVFTATRSRDRTTGRAAINPGPSVYLRDVVAGTTTCLSCDRAFSIDRLAAFTPDLNFDGRMVTFAVQTTPSRSDIVVQDRASRVTTVITRHANARSASPRVSANGNVVALQSWASNLLCRGRCQEAEIDENLLPDVYLFDRTTAGFQRASGGGTTWWSPSLSPAIDGRGQVVVFSSREPFGPEDLTSDFDLFVCSPVCS
jgi:Tol biopolymer transport system component